LLRAVGGKEKLPAIWLGSGRDVGNMAADAAK